MLKNIRNICTSILIIAVTCTAITLPLPFENAQAAPKKQAANKALTVLADIQESDSTTGIITAKGNVQVYYPSRKIQATALQLQYFTKERKIILTGNVYILQEGNSLKGEQVTYLIDEGRFIATPQNNRQVESIYIMNEQE
jgi:lipopolysaccharide export system protein LptA